MGGSRGRASREELKLHHRPSRLEFRLSLDSPGPPAQEWLCPEMPQRHAQPAPSDGHSLFPHARPVKSMTGANWHLACLRPGTDFQHTQTRDADFGNAVLIHYKQKKVGVVTLARDPSSWVVEEKVISRSASATRLSPYCCLLVCWLSWNSLDRPDWPLPLKCQD